MYRLQLIGMSLLERLCHEVHKFQWSYTFPLKGTSFQRVYYMNMRKQYEKHITRVSTQKVVPLAITQTNCITYANIRNHKEALCANRECVRMKWSSYFTVFSVVGSEVIQIFNGEPT